MYQKAWVVKESTGEMRQLEKSEVELLHEQMARQPEMAQYLLTLDWSDGAFECPYWSKGMQSWVAQPNDVRDKPAKALLGRNKEAKKEWNSEEYTYNYSYNDSSTEPEQQQKRPKTMLKENCRSQKWRDSWTEDGDLQRESQEEWWGSQGWQPSSSSWEAWSSSSWDSQQWQDDQWTNSQRNSQGWHNDYGQEWQDTEERNWWSQQWQDKQDKDVSDSEGSFDRYASRGYQSTCKRLERRKLQRAGQPVPPELQPVKVQMSKEVNDKRKYLQFQLDVLSKKLEESDCKGEKEELWDQILQRKKELKELLQPEKGKGKGQNQQPEKDKGKVKPEPGKGEPGKGKPSKPKPEPGKGKPGTGQQSQPGQGNVKPEPRAPGGKAKSKGKPKPAEGDNTQPEPADGSGPAQAEAPPPPLPPIEEKPEEGDDKPDKGKKDKGVKEEPDYAA